MKPLLLSLLALCFTACQATENMKLQLITEPGANDWAYISVVGGQTRIDSAQLVDGKATFQLSNIAADELYAVAVPNRRQEAYFIFEPGSLTVNLTEATVKGTPLSESITAIGIELSNIMQTTSSYAAMSTMLKDSLQSHLNDPVGAFIIYYLDMLTEPEDVKAAYAQLGEHAKATTLSQKLSEAWERLGTTAAGQPYKDFSVEYNGKTTKLSDFIGGKNKLTVVDFWASWCGPCKQEIPNLIAIYNKYHSQGVEVVGVATWDKPEATLKAIEQLGIPYPQILNAQSIGSDAYGIKGIPEIMLIDANGTILARGLRESAIEKAILDALK